MPATENPVGAWSVLSDLRNQGKQEITGDELDRQKAKESRSAKANSPNKHRETGDQVSNTYDTFMFYAGTYPDVESAEQGYRKVEDLYYGAGLIDTFDAAVIAKKEDGKVKIHKKHEQPTRHGGWVGAGWGLATGLVIALFPAAAIGAGLLVGTTGAAVAIEAISEHVLHGMNRGDLKDLGDHLDTGEAALIVAAASDIADKVEAAMSQASKIEARQAMIDTEDLEKESKEAQDEASSGNLT